jgi:hypothetical protein
MQPRHLAHLNDSLGASVLPRVTISFWAIHSPPCTHHGGNITVNNAYYPARRNITVSDPFKSCGLRIIGLRKSRDKGERMTKMDRKIFRFGHFNGSLA